MRRHLVGAYGLLGYLAFLLPIGYLVGFLADVGVPKSVNRGAGPWGPSLAIDLMLLALFGLQHSTMARPGFKVRLRRWLPDGLERSTYVLLSGLVLTFLLWAWRPVPAVLWDVSGTPMEVVAWTGYAAGWALAVWATFALGHLHLFGVTQAAAYARERDHPRMVLRTSVLYRLVRHPMTAGLLLAFWSTPRLTLGHLAFAMGMTVYSLIATVLEERDLLRSFPESYRAYQTRVPALIPLLRLGLLLPRRAGLATEIGLVFAGTAAASYGLVSGLGVVDGPADLLPVERGELGSGGRIRGYALHDPAPGSVDPRPLVLALHGTGGSADRLRAFLGGALERRAAERGWVVAYPEAYEGAWNDCREAVRAPARLEQINDVAFLSDLVERLRLERNVDARRVYLLGYSGGGHMAFRAALESSERVAAIAVFGASLPTDAALACTAPGGVPSVMIVNGTHDLVNPIDGGDVIAPAGLPLGPVRSSTETARFFERRGGDVALFLLAGGGHSVPGTASRFPAVVGPTVRSLEGVDEALRFFQGRRAKHADK